MKLQKGFTLIELIIVIAILGVLAAAIIPNLGKFIGSGDVAAANAELAGVRTAIAAYQADNNGFLPVLADGTTLDNDKTAVYNVGVVKGIYYMDSKGLIINASNGGWSAKIKWSVDKWVKAD